VWWTELEGLLSQGYEPVFNGLDEQAAARTPCGRCGNHRMEYRGFSIAGIVNRSYALCDMCEHWLEF
jgi:hypothetical protein